MNKQRYTITVQAMWSDMQNTANSVREIVKQKGKQRPHKILRYAAYGMGGRCRALWVHICWLF